MKSILLVGLGRFGRHVALKLHKLGDEVLAIDWNEQRINDILPYVTNALIGDATQEQFLASLGIKNFDTCIVAIGDSFENSLIVTSLLQDLGAGNIISRATTDIQEKLLLRNGADRVIYPEKQLAAWTAIQCTNKHVLEYIELDDEYSIFEIMVPPEWLGKSILDLDIRKNYHINILGIRDNGQLSMDLTLSKVFHEGQSILISGKPETIQKYFRV